MLHPFAEALRHGGLSVGIREQFTSLDAIDRGASNPSPNSALQASWE